MIEPINDAYGSFARVSAMADYAELLALRGKNASRESLKDLVEDSDILLREKLVGPEFDTDVEALEGVFAQLEERRDVLGGRYPFEVVASNVVVKPELRDGHLPYLALLCLTVAHAWRVSVPSSVPELFEETVTSVLQGREIDAAGLGALRRAKGNFEDAVRAAGDQLDLKVNPEAIVRSKQQHDKGVDVIAHVNWKDGRRTRVVWVGQVTLEKSDGWQKKLDQPNPGTWRRALGLDLAPVAFLAVPHHIEGIQLANLAQSESGFVLDRLRLTLFKDSVTPDEQAIIDAVRACEVQAA